MALQSVLPSSRVFFSKHGMSLALLAMVALLAWMLAQWFWVFADHLRSKPAPAPAASTAPAVNAQAAADAALNGHLFGRVAAVKPVEANTVSTLNIKLKGVFASGGVLPAFAIVNKGGKDEPVKTGGEVMPGVTLESVKPAYIVVKRDGQLERINLDEKGQVLTTASRPIGQAASQFKLNVPQPAPNTFTFSRAELTQSLQDPKQLTNLGRLAPAPGGGMAMEEVPPGSLAERLGLIQGDVVKSVNGQAVNTMADLSRLYGQFATASQISLEGNRGGRPISLSYTVQQ
jgi:general secretion pathway protein C